MKTRSIILYFIGLLALCSCDDMFEPAVENNRQEEAMYEESSYAHGLLMYAYERLPYQTTCVTDIATDDAVTNQKTSAYYKMASGNEWSATNNPMSRWNECKDAIQYINLFLTKVDKVKWAPSAASKQQMFIDRLKGEAYALRALHYYYLLIAHAGYADDNVLYGVPLLTEPEDASSDFNQPRATFNACVTQMFADCDSAIALLPMDYYDLGVGETDSIPKKYRDMGAELGGWNLVFGKKADLLVSARIAEAFKAQIALLAASPAFRDGSGVTSERAAIYSADVIKHHGGLESFDPTGNIWYKNKTMLEPSAAEMPEILWREPRHNNTDQERENFPPSLYGSGRVNPSQNLVDAFPMRNGYPITHSKSGYDAKNPYAGRDPRLEEYVIYNGSTYRKTVIASGTYPNGDTYDDNLNYLSTSTRTGYYLKKLLRDDVSPSPSATLTQQHIYPRIRYTEIFLAYAEAANDAWGPKADPMGIGFTAYDVIKAIRKRAKLGTNEGGPLPEGDAYLEECASDQAKMAELIRNERRLELCFENKRFWDLRRWKMPLNESIRGINWTSPTEYTFFDVDVRTFDSSYQWYGPIPKSEVLKWSNLKQNKGWL
ncbi:MAG: RagB/SusD family nutrient uptake outer membrane protein [Bacteroidaceae bacterium]|nr:RagB/SusD family nutrient uptake outer membrane protein [Bacteroidaceae bacterium]